MVQLEIQKEKMMIILEKEQGEFALHLSQLDEIGDSFSSYGDVTQLESVMGKMTDFDEALLTATAKAAEINRRECVQSSPLLYFRHFTSTSLNPPPFTCNSTQTLLFLIQP